MEINGFSIVAKGLTPIFPDEVEVDGFFEGVGKKVTVNRYERDAKARSKCIDFYGHLVRFASLDLRNHMEL